MKRNKELTINILGIELGAGKFPHLYAWAKTNPEGLERTLKSIAESDGGKKNDYTSVAINLESDLAHG